MIIDISGVEKLPNDVFWKMTSKMLHEILHSKFHSGDMNECEEKPCLLWRQYFEKRSPDISGIEIDV